MKPIPKRTYSRLRPAGAAGAAHRRTSLDAHLQRCQQSIEQTRREVRKDVAASVHDRAPPGVGENLDYLPSAKAVLPGTAVHRSHLERLAHEVVTVRFEDHHPVGATSERAYDRRRRLFDVVQDSHKTRAVVARHRIVVETDKIGRRERQMRAWRCRPGALDCRRRLVVAIDGAIKRSEYLIREGTVAAAEIENAAAPRHTELIGDFNGDVPHPVQHMAFDVAAAIHGPAVADLSGALP